MSESKIRRFDDAAWHVPVSNRDEIDWDTEPTPDEAARKFLIEGEGGFYLQSVRIPPSFEAPLHHHDHAEIFLVLEGKCSFNGEPMRAHDCTVVEAGEDYSFKAGPGGVTFLVTRKGLANYNEA
jgi:quercetin dioxygenase-like cupin family protein